MQTKSYSSSYSVFKNSPLCPFQYNWLCFQITPAYQKTESSPDTHLTRSLRSRLSLVSCLQIVVSNKKCRDASKLALDTFIAYDCSQSISYSNSIVAGGFPVQSYSTLLTPFTSLTILLETTLKTSHGICAASAVIKSEVLTALSAMA